MKLSRTIFFFIIAIFLCVLPYNDSLAENNNEKKISDANHQAKPVTDIEEQEKPAKPLAKNSNKTVFEIPIKGNIEKGLAFFVYRSIKAAEDADADAIILNITTFGGGLEAAVQIRDYLIETEVPTYAFINKTRAISAGALIAIATKEIYMAEGSSIGDALPIQMMPGGQPKEAPRKIVDYLRKEFRATAERNGHPPDIAEAMVDPEIEIEGIKKKGTILALTTKEAIKYKLAKDTAESLEELLEKIGLKGATVHRTKLSFAEKLARLISSPSYSWIFLAIGIVGIYTEIKTPGFGVPGMLGMTFLVMFFWGHNIAGLTGYEEVILFILGVVLLLLEVFVIPGFGVTGFTGIVCIVASFIMAMFKFPPEDFPFSITRLTLPMRSMALSTIAIGVSGYFIFKYLPKTSLWSKLSLEKAFDSDKGFTSAETHSELVGKIGVAASPIRPAGTMLLDNRRIDVISEGDFIDRDSEIIITAVQGAKVTVKPVK